jgi:hypothetical protein
MCVWCDINVNVGLVGGTGKSEGEKENDGGVNGIKVHYVYICRWQI